MFYVYDIYAYYWLEHNFPNQLEKLDYYKAEFFNVFITFYVSAMIVI